MRQSNPNETVASFAGLAMITLTIAAGAQDIDGGPGESVPPPTDEAAGEAPRSPEGLLPVPDYSGDLRERAYLLGDWGDSRTSLAEHGVQLEVDFIQHLQSVVSGGRSTGTEYGGSLDCFLQLDLQRMDVLPGALVAIRGESRFGESINGDVGLLLPTNTDLGFPLTSRPDDDLALAITELTYTQFLSAQFAVFVGKLNTLGGDPNEFAGGRGKTQFGNAHFVFNPVTALSVPYSTLGAGVVAIPSEHVTVTASIFNTADSSTTAGFDDFGDGWTVSLESQFKYTLGRLPGGQNIGFIYAADGDFAQLGGRFVFAPGEGLTPDRSDETWSLYWSGWQYIWSPEDDETPINTANGVPDRHGLGLFARAGIGDDDTLPIDWHISVGLGGRGLIPGRRDDHFGMGYFYSDIQPNRIVSLDRVEDHTQGFEAFYNAELTPSARATLSVQIGDDADARTDTAVVIGARVQLSF